MDSVPANNIQNLRRVSFDGKAGPIHNNLSLVQIMARRLTGDMPLSEPFME